MIEKKELNGDFNVWCNDDPEYCGMEVDEDIEDGITVYLHEYDICNTISISKQGAIDLCKYLSGKYKGDI